MNFEPVIMGAVAFFIIGVFHQKHRVEKGYFEYGGSTVILLIEKNKLSVHDNILKNSPNSTETPIKMGECIGYK